MSEQPDIMVLGLTPQGLFLLREFSKVGKKVLGVGLKGNVGLHSRYGQKVCLTNLKELGYLFSKYLSEKTQIHITSDPFINYLVDNQHEIFDRTECFPNFESALTFGDKILTEHLARTLNISCPRSYRLNEVDESWYDVYPSIVKWSRRYGGEAFKAMLIKSAADLGLAKRKITPDEHLIIQKYIPGEPETDISYGAYYLNGVERAHIVIKQKRQYPYPNGLASYVEEYSGEFAGEIRSIAREILTSTNYSGFVEVECRISNSEQKLYLIEVNPRACGWIKILKRKYADLFTAAHVRRTNDNNFAATWVNIVRDLRASADMLKKNHRKVDLRELLSDYLKNPIMDIFELSDLMPFVCQFKKLFLMR